MEPKIVRLSKAAGVCFLSCLLVSCSSVVPPSVVKSNARLTPVSEVTLDLNNLPPPLQKIPVAVYGFRDQTGQFKGSPDSLNSSQVSQGSASMLVKALRDSGWYLPVEREGLQNLLTERRLIRAIEIPGEKGKPLIDLPNLTPASVIIEGGVIAYESNVRTGGKGANYLGIGASNKYSVDQVTVSLRSVDIRNGAVLNSVSVTKTIFSYAFDANQYAFVSYKKLLQMEIGYTSNEPAQMALREAIESAVIHLTVQGIRDRIFQMQDERQWTNPVVQSYLREESDIYAEDEDEEEENTKKDFPMRSLTPSSRVTPVGPLITKESQDSLPTFNKVQQVKSDSASKNTEAVTNASTGLPNLTNLNEKASHSSNPNEDIFEAYRRIFK
jgi:curli production assembly/transport component CsgG